MEKLCTLRAAIGNDEECPRGWCGFWEHGGAVAQPGCLLERLGLDLSNAQLAYYLNDLRRALDAAAGEDAAARSRRELAQLVPPDLAEN
jgi:hypothetical protein